VAVERLEGGGVRGQEGGREAVQVPQDPRGGVGLWGRGAGPCQGFVCRPRTTREAPNGVEWGGGPHQ